MSGKSLLALTGLLVGCQGDILPPGGRHGGVSPASCQTDAAAAPVRRLGNVEYNRTVQALFPGVGLPVYDLPEPLRVNGFENNAQALNPSPLLIEQYAEAAADIAERAAVDPTRLLPCTPSGNGLECARQFIVSFGGRAHRRPLTDELVARYMTFFSQQATAISFTAAVELTVRAMLLSPQFLYRIEGGADTGLGDVALDGYELASRLSYLLWQSMPDDELFRAAGAGELSKPAELEKQARRLLADPRGSDAFLDFHRQWLDFDRLSRQNKDTALFPSWSTALRDSIREESDRFVKYVFEEGGASISALLTSNTAFVNGPVAALYGVAAPAADWTAVTLPADQRSGLLSRATFLASFAHSTNGSPPLRGVAILEHLLCSRPPPPPAQANTSAPMSGTGEVMTNRELFEERTSPALCQSCHVAINGIGFGLEAFDSTGAFRTVDNGKPVDASGVLVGTDVDGPFQGGVELAASLAASKKVEHCVTTNWFRYAYGRKDTSADACKIDALSRAFGDAGGDVRELLVRIVTSHDFSHRAASRVIP